MPLTELQQHKTMLNQILAATPNYAALFDLNGCFVFANKITLHALHRELHEVLGKSWVQLHPDKPLMLLLEQNLHATLEAHEPLVAEVTFQPEEGVDTYLEVSFTPLFGKEGQVISVLATGVDVTQRNKSDMALVEREKLRLALEKERELGALRDHIITTIAHEFRTPLAIILSSSELLSRYFDRFSEEKRQNQLYKIKSQINNLTEMLNDVSMSVQGRFNTLALEPSQFDFHEVTASVIREMQLSEGGKHVTHLQVEDGSYDVWADQFLIRRMLFSLLSNAFKYSDEGTIIDVLISHKADDLVLQVRDRGIGILQEDLELIFEPFHRGGNILNIGGTGLGLAIVKDVVVLHKGIVLVDTKLNEGTDFKIYLPILMNKA